MKVFFHTLGCKVNRYETERMLEDLGGIGYELTQTPKDADLIVVNSCTVTAESDRKTRQITRRYKRQNPNATLVLTGCMPQAFPDDAATLPADIIIGNGSGRNIADEVESYLKNRTKIMGVTPHPNGEFFETGALLDFSERTRAYMKIEDGCNRGCTYCIIPKARGRVRSRSLEYIKTEAKNLVAKGFKELVLVGINLSSYGSDLGLTLADAVKTVAEVDSTVRVRLGSLEPDLTTEPLLLALRDIPQFCPQFHLSLQSGCDATLKRMNRLYTADEYLAVCSKIKSLWNNASITTDIMVGFIGESEEEFNQSLDFAKKAEFLKAHIFPYSVRQGTVAARMSGRVDEQTKAKRAEEMASVCDGVSKTVMGKTIGSIRSVLFERRENGYTTGYSEEYMPVFVKENKDLQGKVVKVKIKSLMLDGVLAEPVE